MSPPIIVYVPPDPSHKDDAAKAPDRVNVQDILRAAAFLLQHPERWEEFKMKFGLATADAALKLAANKLPPEVVAMVREKLGL